VPNETVNFEVYALKYATRDAQGSEHFYGHDIHDYPMPMDYFVWAAVSDEYTIVVDAGFTAEVAARRGREHLRCPTEGLQQLGIDCARVSCVMASTAGLPSVCSTSAMSPRHVVRRCTCRCGSTSWGSWVHSTLISNSRERWNL
jgi:hypothetical protein